MFTKKQLVRPKVIRLYAVICIMFSSIFSGLSVDAAVPSFLPSYYQDVLKVEGQPLQLRSRNEKDSTKLAYFISRDNAVSITVEHLSCNRRSCDALFNQNIKVQDERLSASGGKFLSVSSSEFVTTWQAENKASYLTFFTKIPNAIIVWTRATKENHLLSNEPYLSRIRSVMKRHRFEEAMKLDNIGHGLWADDIHQYAQVLLSQGKTDNALDLLRKVIIWSPFHFEAHLDIAENTKDDAGRASALIVWENAENPQLIARAALLLGRKKSALSSLPPLDATMRGLQVVLVPLQPCDIQLLKEVARLYSENFHIPVQIARLPDDWSWGAPDRVYQQRAIQSEIMAMAGQSIDFTGWNKERYVTELQAAADEKLGPLKLYYINAFLDDFAEKHGQFRADTYVNKLISIRTALKINDPHTMVVGVTSEDIYIGDSNFIFSGTTSANGVWAAILSYAQMQASVLKEPYQSRERLAERLAKELVPATLKQLNIPRPADPRDPYSYSDGVARLDQKTLTLSPPTREALDRFRD